MAGGTHPLLHDINVYVAQDCTGLYNTTYLMRINIYIRADLHGTTLSHVTSSRQPLGMNCFM